MKQNPLPNLRSISDLQTINPHLGTGYSSTVSLVEYTPTRQRFALKSVPLTR